MPSIFASFVAAAKPQRTLNEFDINFMKNVKFDIEGWEAQLYYIGPHYLQGTAAGCLTCDFQG